ncbi:IucA/IucC family protein [Brenneria izbisi]|uniref:IucA/IucC family siderophore biosynthesis protein n=1 Tax=Brenneria izbisi TaxID=2939450 RepID=A0AA42C205_9GAMM|nr:IucA/IucC family protein [Brenneria izbisi]MCV9878393.1 IucA/IucC family siderophore biosynthesis protein [Brenneria izbisi]MCV9881816.1 IucA/IucC family siderophore biosynthesis protein [Brenneria izbisi]
MNMQRSNQVNDVAAQCFLNALIRETKDWYVEHAPYTQSPTAVMLPLSPSRMLRIPLIYFSATQHHRYRFPAQLLSDDSSQDIDFATLVSALLEKPAIAGNLPAQVLASFRQRVLESHHHTHQAIAQRLDWPTLRRQPLTFAQAEQGLLVGHAFHPAPKSHQPFNEAQAQRYLPDFAARFPLHWFAVAKEQIGGESLGISLQQRLLRFAIENAPDLIGHVTDDVWLLPMHPWQAEHLLQQNWCQQLVQRGMLRDMGEAGQHWLPTSSSRSLYCPTSRDMIKFSLSVRLTNSIRTLSIKELKRGMRLARLAKTSRWQALQARYPTFQVMQEDGWAGLRNLEGEIENESLFALRHNLLFGDAKSQTNVLVTLTQAAPDGGDSLLTAAVRRLAERLSINPARAAQVWLSAYCQHVLTPLFSAEADYGLVLLAHQQNILVEMKHDLPVGMLYRDCQGSGFTQQAQTWLEEIGEADAENRFTTQQLLRYFPYYLLVNSTLAVTAALAAADFGSEPQLMAQVRSSLTELRATAMNTGCLDYVLDSPVWNCKGNFFCYLHDHNENTIVDPAVIYFDFPNPLLNQEMA